MGRLDISGWRACALASLVAVLVAFPSFASPALATSASRAASMEALKEQSTIRVGHLLNIFKFVTWPENAVKSERFVLCVLGDNPFGSSLYDVDGVQMVRDKPVRVVVDISPDFAKYCHAVYVSGSEANRLPARLKELKGRPLLTVSSIEGFADAGGMVELRYERDNRVFIRGNPKAAEAESLRISSKLLTLSR